MAGKVIHGLKAVAQAVQTPNTVNRIYFAKESRARGVQSIVEQVRDLSIPFDYVPQAKINALTKTKDHQGIAAEISPVPYAVLEECLDGIPAKTIWLALDQVQHSRNLGMIIRTAVGAGVTGLLLPTRGTALLDDTVMRSSTGTVLSLPIIQSKNLGQDIQRCKDSGFWVYGLDASGTQDAFETQWPDRVLLIAGNETKGMRPGIRKQCDEMVSISLAHELDSLNVAVATSIVLFQVRHALGLDEA
jgi:23S rRNA (guanosine2251-2'-O)-methyltransferase